MRGGEKRENKPKEPQSEMKDSSEKAEICYVKKSCEKCQFWIHVVRFFHEVIRDCQAN